MKHVVSNSKHICFNKIIGGMYMNEIKVQSKKNVLDENERTFEERKIELDAISKSEKEQAKRERNSPFKNFLQVNKDTYKLEDKLMKQNPLAYRIWRFLANNMDSYNAVMVSYSVMTDIFEVSRTTLYRAIKVLDDENYIKIYKSGTSNIYTLNDNMVWNSWGSNKRYSKFGANVIINEEEQTNKVKKELKLKIDKHKEVKLQVEKE